MSTYKRETKNPKTGEWENATWMDDHFGRHHYGVYFPHDDEIIDPEKVKLETRDRLPKDVCPRCLGKDPNCHMGKEEEKSRFRVCRYNYNLSDKDVEEEHNDLHDSNSIFCFDCQKPMEEIYKCEPCLEDKHFACHKGDLRKNCSCKTCLPLTQSWEDEERVAWYKFSLKDEIDDESVLTSIEIAYEYFIAVMKTRIEEDRHLLLRELYFAILHSATDEKGIDQEVLAKIVFFASTKGVSLSALNQSK